MESVRHHITSPATRRPVIHDALEECPTGKWVDFDEFAGPLFQQINTLAAQVEKLRTARDLLLPRLMSGEIAV